MTDSTSWTATVRTPPQYGSAVQSQASAQTSRGHTFGNTVVQSNASALFGDSYTSYHIYNAEERANSTTRSTLTISDAFTGILAAGARVISSISTSSNPTLQDACEEFIGFRIVLLGLQRLINDSSSVAPERTRLIELDDIVTIMTQLVLLYSEFEALIECYTRGPPRRQDLAHFHPVKGDNVARLLGRLQRHKTTLSIILQILNCQSSRDAQNQASLLARQTEHELADDPILAERLQSLGATDHRENDIASVDGGVSSMPCDADVGRAAKEDASPTEGQPTTSIAPPLPRDIDRSLDSDDMFFEVVVAESRVYRRVEHLEVDAISTCRSTRSQGWSILSGLTASQVTSVGVILLPFDSSESIRFREPPALDMVDTPVQSTEYASVSSFDPRNSLHDDSSSASISMKVPTVRFVFERLIAEFSVSYTKSYLVLRNLSAPHDPRSSSSSPVKISLRKWGSANGQSSFLGWVTINDVIEQIIIATRDPFTHWKCKDEYTLVKVRHRYHQHCDWPMEYTVPLEADRPLSKMEIRYGDKVRLVERCHE